MSDVTDRDLAQLLSLVSCLGTVLLRRLVIDLDYRPLAYVDIGVFELLAQPRRNFGAIGIVCVNHRPDANGVPDCFFPVIEVTDCGGILWISKGTGTTMLLPWPIVGNRYANFVFHDPIIDLAIEQRTISDHREFCVWIKLLQLDHQWLQCLDVDQWFSTPQLNVFRFTTQISFDLFDEARNQAQARSFRSRDVLLQAIITGKVAGKSQLNLQHPGRVVLTNGMRGLVDPKCRSVVEQIWSRLAHWIAVFIAQQAVPIVVVEVFAVVRLVQLYAM